MDVLIPCPFCGSGHVWSYKKPGGAVVTCLDCHVEIEDLTLELAIKKWNTRPREQVYQESLDILKPQLTEVINQRDEFKHFLEMYSEAIKAACVLLKKDQVDRDELLQVLYMEKLPITPETRISALADRLEAVTKQFNMDWGKFMEMHQKVLKERDELRINLDTWLEKRKSHAPAEHPDNRIQVLLKTRLNAAYGETPIYEVGFWNEVGWVSNDGFTAIHPLAWRYIWEG